MKTVLVTPKIHIPQGPDGIGTFTWHLARLLKAHGDEVEVMFTHRPDTSKKNYERPLKDLEIPFTYLESEDDPLYVPVGYDWQQAMSEAVAERLPKNTDIVYFADWEANGFHYTRSRRFGGNPSPVCVTMLHGCSEWNREGLGIWPGTYHDLALDFRESYSAQYSDFVAAPSQYALDWARDNGWILPPAERVRALGMPFLPELNSASALPEPNGGLERLIFFGRLDTRSGIDLFVESLIRLNDNDSLDLVKEIVLLGKDGLNPYGSSADLVQLLQSKLPDIEITSYSAWGRGEAQTYLAEQASKSLVVVPTRVETMGYSVIEASLVDGLNAIFSNVGGIPEVLGPSGQDQLFEPRVDSLVGKVEERLRAGAHASRDVGRYDWEGANQRWLAFHEEVGRYASQARQVEVDTGHWSALPVTSPAGAPGAEDPSSNAGREVGRALQDSATPGRVDVCIPYYNLGEYLPHTLDSLEAQTSQDFNVFVVNDGSTDPQSIKAFDDLAQKYQHRKNWHFVSQENQGACQAMNFAASLGQAEFLCFVDADNITAPQMMERFIEAILHSGDDCLTCYLYCFEGEVTQVQPSGLLHHPVFHYMPLGNSPALGILHNPYGDTNCIMRRSAFEAVGGFTTDVPKDIGHPDRELFTLLSLAGYRLDVIPEYLLYYRQRRNSWLRSSDNYLNDKRVVRHYTAKLKEVGLEGLAPITVGQYYAIKEREGAQSVAGLQTWVAELTGAVEWHKQQSEAWEKTSAEQQAFIIELTDAAEWHKQQSEHWERLATTQPAERPLKRSALAIPRRLRRLARRLLGRIDVKLKAARKGT